MNQIAAVINGNVDSTNLASSAVATANIADGAVTASKLATSAITLGYTQITTSFTLSASQSTQTLVTGLSLPVTIPSGGRKIKITFSGILSCATAADFFGVAIWDGTVGSGTSLQKQVGQIVNANGYMPVTAIAVVTPAAGSKTYNIGLDNDSGNRNVSVIASASSPAFILVEVI